MAQLPHTHQESFVRDRFTWLAYLMLAYFSYLEAGLGPSMPFLRAELGASYTMGGLLISVLAGGIVLAGLFGDALAGRWGRRRAFWVGGAGMAVGALCLTAAGQMLVAFGGVLIMGACGGLLLVMIQATLADRHGPRRVIALTESNIAASICASLAPLLIGSCQRVGLGWRVALWAGLLGWLVLGLLFRGEPIPDAHPRASAARQYDGRLPTSYWAYWVVVVLCVAVEWSLISWSADFMSSAAGISRVNAVTFVAFFFLAMVVGRVAGSLLTRHVAARTLLVGALLICLAGFPVFWIARVAPLNVAGLFVAGLGIANLYPMTLSIAVSQAPRQSNVASARLGLAVGLATLVGPFVLGWLADQLTIERAMGAAGMLLVVSLLVTLAANRLTTTAPPAGT